MSITLNDIQKAKERIAPYITETPLLRLHSLDAYLGCQVYAKAECMQITGAFKLRGALNKICQLTEEQLQRGIVAASSGNHGKAVAYTCLLYTSSQSFLYLHQSGAGTLPGGDPATGAVYRWGYWGDFFTPYILL